MANKIEAAEAAEHIPLPPSDPALPLNDIQGDILVGLTKTAEVFVFFEIVDAPTFKTALRLVAGRDVTSVQHVRDDDARIKKAKEAAASSKREPGLLEIRHLNIAFSASGLEKLAGPLPALPQMQVFRDGAASRASLLHDPVDGTGKPIWDPEFDEARQHGLLIATGESIEAAEGFMQAVLQEFGASLVEVHRHIGHVRPGEHRGQEHFGFEDGISQPGIRGLTARENPHNHNQGVPGQDLLWPGEFVFGWPAQIDKGKDITLQGPVRQPPIDWMANGSFLVFRKLEQQVHAFSEFLKSEGRCPGLDPEVLGARLVGRWKSGAPIVKAPLQDDELLAADRLRNNHFEFGEDDPDQRRCPYAAHIRKTYPRDDLNEALGKAGEVGVQLRRLRRAGIPYGQEVDEDDPTAGTRGLTFVAYMTSIEDQFEFVQISWSNNPGFVFGKKYPGTGDDVVPGTDAIIGQPAPGEPFEVDEVVPNYPVGSQRSTLTLPGSFVTPRFAGYYFSPSLSALKGTLSD